MAKLTAKQHAAWDAGRDLNAELRVALGDAVRWARKTDFKVLADGRMRRRVVRRDGTVEKDEMIPAGRVVVAAARAGTGLSQAEFAKLLGVSVRPCRIGSMDVVSHQGPRRHCCASRPNIRASCVRRQRDPWACQLRRG